LTGVTADDPLLANLAYDSGDTSNPGVLDVGETWTYKGTYTVLQSDLDNNGGGDGDIDNTSTAASTETGSDTASAAVGLSLNPGLNVTKSATETSVDSAGDVIHYTVNVQNTGNVALTGVPADAPLLANRAYDSGDTSNPGVLDVGETWTYKGTYTVLQSDLDNNGGGDGDIDNTGTADSNETGSDTASAAVGLSLNPGLNVTKSATETSVDSAGDVIHYTVNVQKTGNVALTGVTADDP